MIMSSCTFVVKNGFYESSVPKCPPARSSSCPPKISSFVGVRKNSSVSTQVSEEFSFIDPTATTLMVRNIPTRFTSSSFIDVLCDCGYSGTFDFFYLPMDFRTGKNMGYAFLNFTLPYYAQLFAHMFNGTRLGLTTSSKVLHITISRRQGLIENIELFRNSDLLSSESYPCFKPFVLVPMLATDVYGSPSFCPVLSPLTSEIFTYLTQKTF